MDPLARLAFVALVAGLFGKLMVLTAIQGRDRIASKVFRWPEDAVHFRGDARPGNELERVERAQAALRNDAENHPYALVATAAWLVSGAPGAVACSAVAAYLLVRWWHGRLMLYPIQPLRTRVYALGQLLVLGIVIDSVRRVAGSL